MVQHGALDDGYKVKKETRFKRVGKRVAQRRAIETSSDNITSQWILNSCCQGRREQQQQRGGGRSKEDNTDSNWARKGAEQPAFIPLVALKMALAG